MLKNIYMVLRTAAIIAICLTIPVGAAKFYTLYVTNATPYYIDLSLEEYYESYVPPGETVALEGAKRELTAIANYSPGQGIEGRAVYTFDAPFPQPYSTGTDCAGRAVMYGETDGCGQSTIAETYPGYPDTGEWVVTEAMMAGEEEPVAR